MTPDKENEMHVARLAMAFIQKHDISPNPENYAVCYYYAAARNKDLVREVDTILHDGLAFDQNTCNYLYNKYILDGGHQKAVDEAAVNAQKVLIEVLKSIQEFSGETKSYNQDVDSYLTHITDLKSNDVGGIVKELIAATTTLKQSGEKMNQKLEESKKEIDNLKHNLQQVTIESQRDFLTGVLNRKTFEKLIDEQMALVKDHHADLCLLMIDIDHFKLFNDRFGHLLGDEVLKIVARALTDTLKGRDAVARFGGEEFIVMLPETPLEGARKVAEMIRATIASKELKRRDTGETYGSITVSIGISRFRYETDGLPSLIKRADDALYQSKRNGRNQVTAEGHS